MNIKEHIEAGHYGSVTTKYLGGAQTVIKVAMSDGRVASIYTTNHTPAYPIAGSIDGLMASWTAEGWTRTGGVSVTDLLPPPPRKMPFRAWVGINHGVGVQFWWKGPDESDIKRYERIVELTGEYEEPWS